jgi:hypothetical protein
MYMMYPSHPMAKNGDKLFMEPALGSVIPQYLEPRLAGTAVADAVSVYGFPLATLIGGIALVATSKRKSVKGVGAIFIALSAISAAKEAHVRGVF